MQSSWEMAMLTNSLKLSARTVLSRFRRGLNTKLRERLNTVRADTFNELVNLAISQEDCIVAHRAEKKRMEELFLNNL